MKNFIDRKNKKISDITNVIDMIELCTENSLANRCITQPANAPAIRKERLRVIANKRFAGLKETPSGGRKAS